MDNLNKEVKEIISKVAKVPIDKIQDDSNLFNDLGVDSLIGVEIFAAIDKKYQLDIPEDRLQNIESVGDVIRLVESYLK